MHPRRSFLSHVGVAAAALGLGGAKAFAQRSESDRAQAVTDRPQQTTAERASPWQPARHQMDDWLDQIPGKHRLFFDTLSDAGLREARGFANNYFDGNKNGYGLEQNDLAVIICLRHSATPFAFTDPFWAKYGPAIAGSLELTDPKIAVNPHRAQLDALIKRGVHYAVCDVASHRYAGLIARKTHGDAEAIYKEMTATVVGNAHFVTAGIIAVNRAQERGYSIAHAG